MSRTVINGAVVALLAALLAATAGALGITTIWPVLLAVAVGLVAGHVTLGRIAAFAVGALVSWLAMALGAAALPQTGLADAIAVFLGLAILAVISIATADRAPLWAGLIGYAAFAGLYEPIFAANPTLFLSESPLALLSVLLSGALGLSIAALAQLVPTGSEPSVVVGDEVTEGGVR